ncbi:MAG: hypothetical protein R3F37_08415 [Candidatus Competibacteraceae bacterium]
MNNYQGLPTLSKDSWRQGPHQQRRIRKDSSKTFVALIGLTKKQGVKLVTISVSSEFSVPEGWHGYPPVYNREENFRLMGQLQMEFKTLALELRSYRCRVIA